MAERCTKCSATFATVQEFIKHLRYKRRKAMGIYLKSKNNFSCIKKMLPRMVEVFLVSVRAPCKRYIQIPVIVAVMDLR